MAILVSQTIVANAQTHSLPTEFTSESTLIVVIEFQKTWTQKGNFLHQLIKKPLKENDIVDKMKNFLSSSRQKGYKVIQAPLVLDKSKKDEYKKMPFMPKLMNAFTAGTWKAEFEEGIYQPTDMVARGRRGFDACVGSNLQSLIKTSKCRNILIAGFLTDQCVEATLKTLKKDGLNVVIVKDGTATMFKSTQRKVEKRNQSATTNELLTIMK